MHDTRAPQTVFLVDFVDMILMSMLGKAERAVAYAGEILFLHDLAWYWFGDRRRCFGGPGIGLGKSRRRAAPRGQFAYLWRVHCCRLCRNCLAQPVVSRGNWRKS